MQLNVAQVQEPDGSWSVLVNGRKLIDRESYQIASNIAYALSHPEIPDSSECGQLAAMLRGDILRNGRVI